MEKQIQTVYVGTMEDTTLHLAKRKGEWNALNSSMNLCHSLKEVRAYLYTPEEHAAAQQALSKAEDETSVGNDGFEFDSSSTCSPPKFPLKNTKAEDKGDNGFKPCPKHPNVLTSQCGICKGDFPQPTNILDELEYYQNARETFSNAVSNLDIQTRTACDSFILAFDHLFNHVSDIHAGNIKK